MLPNKRLKIVHIIILACSMEIGVFFFTSVTISCGKVSIADAQTSCDCTTLADMVSALDARIEALEVDLATVSSPHYPEILTGDGRLAPLVVTTANSNGGSVRYVSGDNAWLGGRLVKLTSFDSEPLDVNSTYHLRLSRDGKSWTWAILRVPYRVPNSTSMTMPTMETDPDYDSTAQSMLVARIMTSDANTSATVTMLANKQTLVTDGAAPGGACIISNEFRNIQTNLTLNWARTPKGTASVFGQSLDDTWLQGYSNTISLSRYGAAINSTYRTQNNGCINSNDVSHRYLLIAP